MKSIKEPIYKIKFVYLQNKNIKDVKTITAKQAQQIIDIACQEWKEILAGRWSTNIVLGKKIEIDED